MLADHVGGFRPAEVAAAEREADAHLALAVQALDEVGVRVRERGGRDLRRPVLVLERLPCAASGWSPSRSERMRTPTAPSFAAAEAPLLRTGTVSP